MAETTESTITTRRGSAIRLLQGGAGANSVFAIGGISVRAFSESGVRVVLEDAAGCGARFVLMDLAGSGASSAGGPLTMESWLDDVEEVYERCVGTPAVWTGASIGAWLMLLAHRRHPAWFTGMCALAPAIDWDQQYVWPALRDGTLRAVDGTVVNADGTALAPGALLVSMQPHHLLGRPFHLAAPLHVIAGLRDELAPAAATRRFIESAQGAPCTGEIIPDGDHGIA